MTTPSKTRNPSSSGERRRLIEESTARAMDLYRLDFEATRAKTSRLREEREALEDGFRVLEGVVMAYHTT
ncbi:MAG: hypothetical protein H2042_16210 [Rhizobiales bacterium]|nr:hypothetical protein [Hyphomicrobiales bacterium]